MKKIILLLLCAIVFMPTQLVNADDSSTLNYDVSSSYTFTVPSAVTVNSSTGNASFNMSLSNVLLNPGQKVKVSVDSDNYSSGWRMSDGGSVYLDYTMKINNVDVVPNTTIIEAEAGNPSATISKTFNVAVSNSSYSGTFTDILEFTQEITTPVVTYVDWGDILDYATDQGNYMSSSIPIGSATVLTGLDESDLGYYNWNEGFQIKDSNHYAYVGYDGYDFKTTADVIVLLPGYSGLNFYVNEDYGQYWEDFSVIMGFDLSQITTISNLCVSDTDWNDTDVHWNKDFTWANNLPAKLTGMTWTASNLQNIFPYAADVILPNWPNGNWVRNGDYYSFVPNS